MNPGQIRVWVGPWVYGMSALDNCVMASPKQEQFQVSYRESVRKQKRVVRWAQEQARVFLCIRKKTHYFTSMQKAKSNCPQPMNSLRK